MRNVPKPLLLKANAPSSVAFFRVITRRMWSLSKNFRATAKPSSRTHGQRSELTSTTTSRVLVPIRHQKNGSLPWTDSLVLRLCASRFTIELPLLTPSPSPAERSSSLPFICCPRTSTCHNDCSLSNRMFRKSSIYGDIFAVCASPESCCGTTISDSGLSCSRDPFQAHSTKAVAFEKTASLACFSSSVNQPSGI